MSARAAPQVVSRLCPECGATMLGQAGLCLFVCPACPLAYDPFEDRRLPTFRPAGDAAAAGPRLAYFLFRVADGAASKTVWVPGFRAVGIGPQHDAGEALTRIGYDPPLHPAPLGAALARDDRASAARSGLPGTLTPVLVSLAAELRGELLREPVSGWAWPRHQLLPPSPP